MAYLDLSGSHPFEAAGREIMVETRLGPQDRLVVLLSHKDPLWSLAPRHGHSKLLRLLFGIEAPHRLADPRLEALRRYAVTYRLRGADVGSLENDAVQSGFTNQQLAQVRRMIDTGRATRSRPTAGAAVRGAMLIIAGLLAFYAATVWLSSRFDSNLVAFVVAAVAMVSFAPLLGNPNAGRRLR